jgi:hypothetical protein
MEPAMFSLMACAAVVRAYLVLAPLAGHLVELSRHGTAG